MANSCGSGSGKGAAGGGSTGDVGQKLQKTFDSEYAKTMALANTINYPGSSQSVKDQAKTAYPLQAAKTAKAHIALMNHNRQQDIDNLNRFPAGDKSMITEAKTIYANQYTAVVNLGKADNMLKAYTPSQQKMLKVMQSQTEKDNFDVALASRRPDVIASFLASRNATIKDLTK